MTDVKQLPEEFLKEMEQLLGDEYEAYIKSYEEGNWAGGKHFKDSCQRNLKYVPPESDTWVDWTEKGFLL